VVNCLTSDADERPLCVYLSTHLPAPWKKSAPQKAVVPANPCAAAFLNMLHKIYCTANLL
jgi:hypothetical protein